jgi:hypothetical protein
MIQTQKIAATFDILDFDWRANILWRQYDSPPISRIDTHIQALENVWNATGMCGLRKSEEPRPLQTQQY